MSHRSAYLPVVQLLASFIVFARLVPSHGQSRSPEATADPIVRDAVLNQRHLRRFDVQELQLAASAGEVAIDLLLADQPCQIVLRKHSIRAPGFRVLSQGSSGAWREVEVGQPQTYRGYVAGRGGSSVSASIVNGQLRAVVSLGGEPASTWLIEPLQSVFAGAAPSQHLVYRSEDVAEENGICGNNEQPTHKAAKRPLPTTAEAAMDVAVCRIACDADFEYYGLNASSVSNTVTDIETVLNGVSAIYERDVRVTFQLTQILVRTAEPDPYTSADISTLLAEFRQEWRNNQKDISRDVAHLFTGKNLGTPLGLAYQDQLCLGLDHYSLARSRSKTDLAVRIALSAHENGHNFDAYHCDDDADPRCRIMCSGLGACSNGYHSFEDSNVDAIRSSVARSRCLTAGTLTTPSTTLPFADNFDSINYPPQPPNPAKWTAVDYAECQYKHLEIKIGRGYSNNQQLGTVRTLPMRLSGPAELQYKVNAQVPAGQAFRTEYFDSATFTWKLLRTVTSDGTIGYRAYVDAVPAAAAGDSFAVRFSAYASAYTSSTAWYVDDVSIVESVIQPQLAIARTDATALVITWPKSASGWQLETVFALTAAPGAWTPIPPPYPTNATQFIVTEPTPADIKFYRLRLP